MFKNLTFNETFILIIQLFLLTITALPNEKTPHVENRWTMGFAFYPFHSKQYNLSIPRQIHSK